MKTYARIDSGLVAELFQTDGDITQLFHPELVWVDVTSNSPQPQFGWTYDGKAFAAPPGITLAQAQAAQIADIYTAYKNAIAQNVSYTTKAGVAQTFQADPDSIGNVNDMLSAYAGTQTTPSGFYWVAADNTQVPFAYADLQGLAAAMGNQGWSAFQNLQNRKASIKAATTIAAVQAVTW